jgi:hypothetical protein
MGAAQGPADCLLPSRPAGARDALHLLYQRVSVDDYTKSFSNLKIKVPGMTLEEKLYLFIKRLKTKIKISVAMQDPKAVKQAKIFPPLPMESCEESWIREWELSEACLFIPKGSFHLLLLIAIVLATTRRDLVVATERGPYLVWAVHIV